MSVIDIEEAASATSSPATALRIAVRRWRKHMADPLHRYRPELHYMRGPGPKCGGTPKLPHRAR